MPSLKPYSNTPKLHYSVAPSLVVSALAAGAVFLALPMALGASAKTPGKIAEQFSGQKALAHVQHLVDLGPRPPASDAIEKARDYIASQLKTSGWQTTLLPTRHRVARFAL
jgi:hypothetical protein